MNANRMLVGALLGVFVGLGAGCADDAPAAASKQATWIVYTLPG